MSVTNAFRLPRLGSAKANAMLDAQVLATFLRTRSAIDQASAILARDIVAELGAGWTDRRIRAAAEVSAHILSAPGCAGYAVLVPDDIRSRAYALECALRHRSQVRHQLARAERNESALHA